MAMTALIWTRQDDYPHIYRLGRNLRHEAAEKYLLVGKPALGARL